MNVGALRVNHTGITVSDLVPLVIDSDRFL